MIINVTDQACITPALPLRRCATFVDSSIPVAVIGVPTDRADGTVTGVTVALTNADGIQASAPCALDDYGAWRTAFAGSCFPTFGYVARGVKVTLTLDDDGVSRSSTLAVGDLEIMPDAADSRPGDPSAYYQQKGGDIYAKSEIVDDVQHYKRIGIEYNADMAAWAFSDPAGDYILVNGEFQEVEP